MPDQLVLVPKGTHVTNSSLGSAVTLAPEDGASHVLMQTTGANLRYTLDGTTPTASVGFRLLADDDPELIAWTTGVTIKVIQESSGATLQAQWVRVNVRGG